MLFVDLKAAFDMIDREVLLGTMRKRGIRKGLVKKVKKMFREIKSRVRRGDRGNILDGKGARQECPVSQGCLLLFSLLIADLEEEIKKVGYGGVEIGGERVCCLVYEDDVALITEEEGEMKSMMWRFKEHLEKKRLVLNVKQTKIMGFKKGGERVKETSWR